MTYYIHFYKRNTSALSEKHGYKAKEEARKELRKNGFSSKDGEIWERLDYLARIKVEK